MKKPRILLACLAGALLCAGFWWWQRPAHLDGTDLLLVGDVVNETGDPVFDHSLTLALRTALSQSPYLNLIAEQKAKNAIQRLGKAEHEPLSENLAQAICANLGAKAYLTGKVRKAASWLHHRSGGNALPGWRPHGA